MTGSPRCPLDLDDMAGPAVISGEPESLLVGGWSWLGSGAESNPLVALSGQMIGRQIPALVVGVDRVFL